MENNSGSSNKVSHRVVREFLSNGLVLSVGDLISDADWTEGGRKYVEDMGWVVRLTPAEIAAEAAYVAEVVAQGSVEPDAPEVILEAPVVKSTAPRKNAAKKVQAAKKRQPAKKPAVKKSV